MYLVSLRAIIQLPLVLDGLWDGTKQRLCPVLGSYGLSWVQINKTMRSMFQLSVTLMFSSKTKAIQLSDAAFFRCDDLISGR
jgi:hypothetical protein